MQVLAESPFLPPWPYLWGLKFTPDLPGISLRRSLRSSLFGFLFLPARNQQWPIGPTCRRDGSIRGVSSLSPPLPGSNRSDKPLNMQTGGS